MDSGLSKPEKSCAIWQLGGAVIGKLSWFFPRNVILVCGGILRLESCTIVKQQLNLSNLDLIYGYRTSF